MVMVIVKDSEPGEVALGEFEKQHVPWYMACRRPLGIDLPTLEPMSNFRTSVGQPHVWLCTLEHTDMIHMAAHGGEKGGMDDERTANNPACASLNHLAGFAPVDRSHISIFVPCRCQRTSFPVRASISYSRYARMVETRHESCLMMLLLSPPLSQQRDGGVDAGGGRGKDGVQRRHECVMGGRL